MNILPSNVALFLLALSALRIDAAEPRQPFSLLGIHVGQPLADVQRLHPSLDCEASCFLEKQTLFGHSGRLWLAYSNGKVGQLTFKFLRDLNPDEARIIEKHYDHRYGRHKVFLGVEGCWEYGVSGGFLDICFNSDMPHIHWAKESRLDVNLQRRSPTRYGFKHPAQ